MVQRHVCLWLQAHPQASANIPSARLRHYRPAREPLKSYTITVQGHKTGPVHYLPLKDEDIMPWLFEFQGWRWGDEGDKCEGARLGEWEREGQRERRINLRIETRERGVQTWQMNLLYKAQLNVGKGHHFSSSASVKSDRAVTSVQASTHPAQTTWQLKVISAPSNSQEGPMWTRTSKYSLSALPFSSFERRARRKIETENNKNPSSRWRGKMQMNSGTWTWPKHFRSKS